MPSVVPLVKTLSSARRYLASGLSVIPIKPDGTKAPAIRWAEYQKRRMTEEEAANHFRNGVGLAIIGGAVSGGLEIIDFDHGAEDIFPQWKELVDASASGLVDLLPRVKTPGGGFHVLYRCVEIAGNTKLATTSDGKTVIETRGEGGYVLAPPSPGSCHPSGKPYEIIRGDLADIPTITPEEREIMLRLARSFDEAPKEITIEKGVASPAGSNGAKRPGDDFNERATWDSIFSPVGWKLIHGTPEKGRWRKPGATDPGHHATTGECGDRFYCFSTAAAPLDVRAYDKFSVYALLNHGGDFKAAARALAANGYGEQKKRRTPREQALEGDSIVRSSEKRTTDTGNAERFRDRHGKDVRYCHPWGKWLSWDGKRWAVDDTGAIQRKAKETALSIYVEAAKEKNDSRRPAIVKFAKSTESARGRRAMLELAQSEEGISIKPDELDRNSWLLNVENGTIDLKTGTLLPHDPADMITKMAPVIFDKAAQAPTWEKFLLEVMDENEGLVDYLRRAFGYALTGDVREQCLFFFHGSGRNGKTTLLNAIHSVMGTDYAGESAPGILLRRDHAQHPTELADLFGKRFISTVEIEEGRRLAEVLVKQLTGGDRIKARRMREDFWEFTPTHKFFLAANHKPDIRGTDDAIWRRIHLVPFNVSFKGREDKRLFEKLEAERAGVLLWLVQGCIEWQAKGLNPPPEVLAAVEEYRNESDPLSDWLLAACVVGKGLFAKSKALYDSFTEWHGREIGGDPITQKAFSSRLAERGFTKTVSKTGRIWNGIGLKMAEGGQ